ncbi:hypothetical protein CEXT_765541 [Caerostris extrusa]|uniref:Uncharacterized protein n=1 Tax=Caerostris extrusa TaxID=172846 RepID=A0AAV4XUI0_CAEEX|nr:hypothetical protein CEXT_765541 [Caerostris extrusa]
MHTTNLFIPAKISSTKPCRRRKLETFLLSIHFSQATTPYSFLRHEKMLLPPSLSPSIALLPSVLNLGISRAILRAVSMATEQTDRYCYSLSREKIIL